jgi:hypothetical protein
VFGLYRAHALRSFGLLGARPVNPKISIANESRVGRESVSYSGSPYFITMGACMHVVLAGYEPDEPWEMRRKSQVVWIA